MWFIEKLDELPTSVLAWGSLISSMLMLGGAGAYMYFMFR